MNQASPRFIGGWVCLRRGGRNALDLWGWMQETAPPDVSALLLPQSHCNSEGTPCRPVVFMSESSTRRRRPNSSLLGLKAMFSGVSRVTSLLYAYSLLWDIQMPFMATDSLRLSVALGEGKGNLFFFFFFFLKQSDDL